MEEEKAAAYYEELSRKGEGAAKYKQGLGFSSSSSSSSSNPFGSKRPSSLLSNFVRASGPKNPRDEEEDDDPNKSSSNPRNDDRGKRDRARVIGSIHGKLNRSGSGDCLRSRSDDRERRRERRDERDRDEDRHSSRRSRDRDRDRDRERRRSRSTSHSPSRVSRSRDRDRDRERNWSSKDRRPGSKNNRELDYSNLIDGYSQMTPAERVKAKMKLQLSQTAAKDSTMGMSSGWERFDFNKDAPLDDEDDETEVAEDDVSVVKDIGRSFRFSAVEAKREEEVKAAHDQAIFGGATTSSRINLSPEAIASAEDEENKDTTAAALLSDKVLSMQQGSWRDRARRLQK